MGLEKEPVQRASASELKTKTSVALEEGRNILCLKLLIRTGEVPVKPEWFYGKYQFVLLVGLSFTQASVLMYILGSIAFACSWVFLAQIN